MCSNSSQRVGVLVGAILNYRTDCHPTDNYFRNETAQNVCDPRHFSSTFRTGSRCSSLCSLASANELCRETIYTTES